MVLEHIALLLARSQLTPQTKCPGVKATSDPREDVELALCTKAAASESRIYALLLQKPESCETAAVPAEEEGEELLLAGHHDLPAELQARGTAPHQAEQDDDFYIKIEFEKVRLMRGWASWF